MINEQRYFTFYKGPAHPQRHPARHLQERPLQHPGAAVPVGRAPVHAAPLLRAAHGRHEPQRLRPRGRQRTRQLALPQGVEPPGYELSAHLGANLFG